MKKFIVLTVLIFGSICYCQDSIPMIESSSRIAGYLSEKSVSMGLETIKTGSCFFVHKDHDIYLVTAKHVAENCTLKTQLTVSNTNFEPKTYKLSEIVNTKHKLEWTFHPKADIAVIHLDSSTTFNEFHSYPTSLLKKELEVPIRTDNLTAFGFPLSLGIGKRFSVISKNTNTASGLIELYNKDLKSWNTYFLLDDTSVSGFSGGPVIQLGQIMQGYYVGSLQGHKNENKIVGLVHGSVGDKRTYGGFAAIVPSAYIVETINNTLGFTGIYKYEYDTGELWSEVEYKNGNAINVISNYKINGESQDKGTLKNGIGTRKIYDEEGNLVNIFHYENGMRTKVEYIDKKDENSTSKD